jgi:uncharacterized SAM-binding protein YcdF (DUF218 family)
MSDGGRRMTKGKWISVVLAVVVAFVGYSAWDIWSFGSTRHVVQTDAAIVLGAEVWADRPSAVFEERILPAIQLYQSSQVRKLIFTGGKGERDAVAESEVARRYAIDRGVDPDDIFVETRSVITEENLRYAREIAEAAGLKTFTIVSDPLHMKRAMTIAEDLGMEAYSSPTPNSAYRSMTTKVPFFLRERFFYMLYVVTAPVR